MQDLLRFQHADLGLQVELPLGLLASQPSPGPVRTGGKTLHIALASDYIAGRALGAGDDAGLAEPGPGRALAVHQDLFVEVVLQRRIVMGDIDHLTEMQRGTVLLQDILDCFEHQAPVGLGELHAVAHLMEITLADLIRHRQGGQLSVGAAILAVPSVIVDGQTIVMVGHPETDIAAAGMDHEPDMAVVGLLDLDEMIAAAQGADLSQGVVEFFVDDRQLCDADTLFGLGHEVGRPSVAVVVEAERNGLADGAQDIL